MDVFNACLLFLFVSFVLLSLYLLYLYKNKSGLAALPPGETGWPLIGESLEYLSTGRKGHPEKFFFDRMAKYSTTTVFKTHLLGEKTMVFCGASGNKFLFSNEYKLVQGWWPSSARKIFPNNTQDSLKYRNMLYNFLKPEALQRYVGVMDHIAQTHFTDGWENRKDVMVFPLAKKYTFWLACRILMSVEDPNQVDEFAKPFNHLLSGVISVPIDLPGTLFNKGIKASNLARKELVSIIKQRKIDLAEGKASPTQDILSQMLLTSDENGKFMHELDIAEKILGFLVGGYTANPACTFIVKYLAELPEIYERVYNEQIGIAKSKASGELLNWEDIQKMKYSWNVACEVLRLASPSQGNFREAIADFVYNGFSVPKGWKLYWSTYSTHKNPEFFPEPEKFDPSRFEGSGPAPYTFVPFGGGPKMCPGKEYARLEILVFMHNLVKRFKWETIIPNEKIVVDPLPKPASGLPVRLFPHKA